MAGDLPYPINPQVDALIQAFKDFQRITFPRGMPPPVVFWKPALAILTHFETAVARSASEYMGGRPAVQSDLVTPPALGAALSSIRPRTPQDDVFLKSLIAYRGEVEKIAALTEDCIAALGNPCRKFRG